MADTTSCAWSAETWSCRDSLQVTGEYTCELAGILEEITRMAPKEKRPLVRTSVQLPQDVLDALARRWPGLSTSECVRLALERHEYIMGRHPELVTTTTLLDENLETVAGALRDFGYTDFLIACRAMPSLVDEHARESGCSREQLDMIRGRIEETAAAERLSVFDAAVTRNMVK